jgi:hypothetical protein
MQKTAVVFHFRSSLRCAHGRFEDPPPHLARYRRVRVEIAQGPVDGAKGPLGDGNFIRVVEFARVRRFQGRPQRDGGPAPQLIGLTRIADHCQQGAGQRVVDDHEVAGHLGRQQPLLLPGADVDEHFEQGVPRVVRPLPGSKISQFLDIHRAFFL